MERTEKKGVKKLKNEEEKKIHRTYHNLNYYANSTTKKKSLQVHK